MAGSEINGSAPSFPIASISSSGPTTNSIEVAVAALNATDPSKLYRIRISYP